MKRRAETIQKISDLAKRLGMQKKRGKKIVLCHGCFDLMHPGHIKYLQAAKAMGDILVVTVTPDRFVDKGPGRPAFNETLRAESLAALSCVDFVALNEWPTAEETLRLLRPDIYVKGQEFENLQDATGKIQRESEVVREIGAELRFTHEIVFSSTKLLNAHFKEDPSDGPPPAKDEFRIDSHKLIFHPDRVAQWQEAEDDWEKAKSVYPIYLDLSPFGGCNHRCVFCAYDFIGYKPKQLDPDIFRTRLTEMAGLGIRSIMFAGEGEPTLWKPLPEILDHCRAVGIDTALTSNLVPVNDRNAESIVRNCAWIKTSINAGTPATYSKIHRTKETDFGIVMENFSRLLSIRKEKGYRCTIGAQMILLPENSEEAFRLGEALRELGVDYLVIKPYSHHHSSLSQTYSGIDYRPYLALEKKLRALNSDRFQVIFRLATITKLFKEDRGYVRCHSTPFFWGHVMADGNVFGCSAFLGDDRFRLGNLLETPFREIWEGERRKALHILMKNYDIRECRRNCRMDEINRYLWSLRHPGPHVNFI